VFLENFGECDGVGSIGTVYEQRTVVCACIGEVRRQITVRMDMRKVWDGGRLFQWDPKFVRRTFGLKMSEVTEDGEL
jgi:hypothetical protein